MPLPIEWKTALATFIPKAGKAASADSLRPISLTLCVGKLMETMVRDRLSEFTENQCIFAESMHGFRPHGSAQDILLQLKEEVILSTSRKQTRAILAPDLEGAFDNVSHQTILDNFSLTNCTAKGAFILQRSVGMYAHGTVSLHSGVI